MCFYKANLSINHYNLVTFNKLPLSKIVKKFVAKIIITSAFQNLYFNLV